MLHWLYSYHYGLVQVEGNQEEVIHKAIMTRARTALTANGIVGCCYFFSSYLALCGIIFLQLIFTFSGFIELLNFGAGKRQEHR